MLMASFQLMIYSRLMLPLCFVPQNYMQPYFLFLLLLVGLHLLLRELRWTLLMTQLLDY